MPTTPSADTLARVGGSRGLGACYALALALAACATPDAGRLLVVVDSDFDAPDPLSEIGVVVEREDGSGREEVPLRVTGREGGAGERTTQLPMSFMVRAPSSGGDVRIIVEGRDARGAPLVSRRAVTGFVAGRTRVLRLYLAEACRMMTCPSQEACDRAGTCVAERVDPADLPDAVMPGDELPRSPDAGTRDDAGPERDAAVSPSCRWRSAAGGQWNTCAIREDGSLWCWGWNNVGQLGLGPGVEQAETPRRVGLDTDWTEITAGEGHTCATRADESLWCWGWNTSGQLGLLDNSGRDRPARVVGGPWSAVRAGYRFTCGRATDGTLHCWGENRQGQLGQGMLGNRNYLSRVGTDSDWAHAATSPPRFGGGGWHACGVRAAPDIGTLWCWGWNSNGQLGVGDTTDRLVATQVTTFTDWVAAAPGYWHTCALRSDGGGRTLWCWGQGTAGRLGLRDTAARTSPVQVGIETDWVDLFPGGHHTCASRRDGSTWCWGANSDGQLGLGDTSHRSAPVALDRTWARIALGGNHTCGIDAAGALFCWGLNTYGMLGLGDTEPRDRPARVPCPE